MPRSATRLSRTVALIGVIVTVMIYFGLVQLVASGLFTLIASVLLASIILVTLVESIWLVPRKRQFFRLTIKPTAVVARHGRLFRRVDVIPMNRIMVIRIHVGVIGRRYGLSQVTLATASMEIHLPPLTHRDAAAVAELVKDRSHGIASL